MVGREPKEPLEPPLPFEGFSAGLEGFLEARDPESEVLKC